MILSLTIISIEFLVCTQKLQGELVKKCETDSQVLGSNTPGDSKANGLGLRNINPNSVISVLNGTCAQ